MHLNPARAKLLRPEQALPEYRWSRWPEYLKAPRQRAGWLRVDRVLGEMGIPQDRAAGRRALEQPMEVRRGAEESTSCRTIRRGWFFGESGLKQELLGQMSKRRGPEHDGEERQASQAEKAERVVAEEMRRRKWAEGTLKERAKGDREKVKMAVRLRQETLVTVAWIAQRLQMGSVANVHTLLYHWRQRKK